MKTITLQLIILLSVNSLYSQDIILLQNGDEMIAKILEISYNEIKYKRFDFLEGPTYTISKSDIFMIKYKNGSKEVFAEQQNKNKLESFNLKSGTLIPIKILGRINSNDKMSNKAIVNQDIIDKNGNVLITYGTVVGMDITLKASESIGKPGTINIEFTSTIAEDGQKIKLTGNKFLEGTDRSTLSWVLTGVGCFVIPPFNFLFLLIKGKPGILPDNTTVYDVRVASSYNIILK